MSAKALVRRSRSEDRGSQKSAQPNHRRAPPQFEPTFPSQRRSPQPTAVALRSSPRPSRTRPPPAMADVSDSAINTAYEDVRSDKSDTNWLLLDYEVRAARLPDPPTPPLTAVCDRLPCAPAAPAGRQVGQAGADRDRLRRARGAARAARRRRGVVRVRARLVRERQGVLAREVRARRLDRQVVQGHAQGQGARRVRHVRMRAARG